MSSRRVFGNDSRRSVSPIKTRRGGHRRGPWDGVKVRVISPRGDEPESRKRRKIAGPQTREQWFPSMYLVFRLSNPRTARPVQHVALRDIPYNQQFRSKRAALFSRPSRSRRGCHSGDGAIGGVSDPLCHPPISVPARVSGVAHAPDVCPYRPEEPRSVRITLVNLCVRNTVLPISQEGHLQGEVLLISEPQIPRDRHSTTR
jgi:hypothetical protein